MKIKSLWAFIKSFYRLSFADKWLLVQAVLWAFCIQISLNIWSYKTIIRFLKRFQSGNMRLEDEQVQVQRYDAMLRRTYKITYFFAKCLAISTAFWFLMRRKGINVSMRFGVRKNEAGIESHAWLEYNNKPLKQDALAHDTFSVFETSIINYL